MRRWRAATRRSPRSWPRATSTTCLSTARTSSALAVGWLTRWPVTREAYVVVSPGERDALFVDFYNHVPLATRHRHRGRRRAAARAARSRTALAELRRRGADGKRIGVIGPLPWRAGRAAGGRRPPVVSLDADYAAAAARQVRRGARVAAGRLRADRPRRRGAARRRTARSRRARARRPGRGRHTSPRGGTTHIHYFATTPMEGPGIAVPFQWPSSRRLQAGDALVCEISAAWWDHSGPGAAHVHGRGRADAALPGAARRRRSRVRRRRRPPARRRHGPAELVDASGVIEDAGFTIRDDLVHGFVGGYLPPVLGSRSRMLGEVPDFTFARGHDRRRPAERRHARRVRRCADRRVAARDPGRVRAAARGAAAGCARPANRARTRRHHPRRGRSPDLLRSGSPPGSRRRAACSCPT